jgi:hypothetical protein
MSTTMPMTTEPMIPMIQPAVTIPRPSSVPRPSGEALVAGPQANRAERREAEGPRGQVRRAEVAPQGRPGIGQTCTTWLLTIMSCSARFSRSQSGQRTSMSHGKPKAMPPTTWKSR